MRRRSWFSRFLPRFRFAVDPRDCPRGTWVLLPRGGVRLACGIAALVEVAEGVGAPSPSDLDARRVADALLASGVDHELAEERIEALAAWARGLKRSVSFAELLTDEEHATRAAELARQLRDYADAQAEDLRERADSLPESDLETLTARNLRVRDVAWHVEQEALSMARGARRLAGAHEPTPKLLTELRRVESVLRSIDRIEIRGRDSAGIAVQVVFGDENWFAGFRRLVAERGLADELERRSAAPELPARAVSVALGGDGRAPCVTFVYKVAAEVGRLGDNVEELRRQIEGDALLRTALSAPGTTPVLLGHTRWASSGVISVPNCHPVDNGAHADATAPESHREGRIFVVMNGDVDNHLELRAEYEEESDRRVSPRITTDTKVVALEIERQLAKGLSVDDAFAAACARFEGSCAIGMVTDLAPGRLFLSLKGSGQSLYVGASPDGFFASSEVYGVVEEASDYLKLDGEVERVPGDASTQGQLVTVSMDGPRGAAGLVRRGLDGAELPVTEDDLRVAEITTRDVDRGDFAHFFRKEITQASRSVSRTLLGRVRREADGHRLADGILSESVRERLGSGRLRRIFVVGQGTAAIAGAGIGEFLRRVIGSAAVRVEALPASEMSGFRLSDDMHDTLVVAVTQSGSTADTNRAVDLARKRGALVAAVVNRRNSDITYRADAVVYTSDGRDVEMSVASTKAFYSQIVAGALLSLAVARALGSLDDASIGDELTELVRLPDLMQQVLDDEDAIRAAAEAHAPTREHWAVVGSGQNQVAAREVRIKLSELCYKSIATDVVEDKKHIDLSCEPLIVVHSAGNPDSVTNDVVKDVAIFQAHKALPIVFAAESERRFDAYATALIRLPDAPPLSSMILNALAGHLFGYHAARAIDENARFLGGVRALLVDALEDDAIRDSIPDELGPARAEFLDRLQRGRFTSSLHPVTAVRLALLFDRVCGFGLPSPETDALTGGDAGDDVAALVNVLGDALDQTARPVDAIKHQAKIVTVGTSRPEAELGGALGDALRDAGVDAAALAPVDQFALRRLQPAIQAVAGATTYAVGGLRADGSPGESTTLRVTAKSGVAAGMASRADQGTRLAGTKREVVHDRRLYAGRGLGDGRSLLIVPVLGADRHVDELLLLHVKYVEELGRDAKERLLGNRLERLRDRLEEAGRRYEPALLDQLTPEQCAVEDADDLANHL